MNLMTYSRTEKMPKRVKRDLLYQNRMQNNIFRQHVAISTHSNFGEFIYFMYSKLMLYKNSETF